MKKLILLFLLLALVISASACTEPEAPSADVPEQGSDAPASSAKTATEFKIDGVPVTPLVIQEPGISFMNNVDILFRFAVEDEMYKLIKRSFESFGEVSFVGVAGLVDGDEVPTYENSSHIEPEYNGTIEVDGVKYRTYTVRLLDVMPENYGLEYTANLYMCFKNAQTSYTVPVPKKDMPVTRVYTAALNDYTDRSDSETEVYKYLTSDGSYSPYEDLSPYYSVLASCLYLTIEDGIATDVAASDYYSSPYAVSYFDGVLEIAMKNGTSINLNIFRSLVINGEKTYFELVDGMIRLVYFE